MAVELEPSPELVGTRMSQWMRRPAGMGLPASSQSRRNARATRLLPSRGRPAAPRPSTVTSTPSPSSENRTSFQRSSAMPRQSNPGPRLAVVAGTLTRQAAPEPGAPAPSPPALISPVPQRASHASSPYSVTSGSPPLRRPLRHLSTAHTTMTTRAATTA